MAAALIAPPIDCVPVTGARPCPIGPARRPGRVAPAVPRGRSAAHRPVDASVYRWRRMVALLMAFELALGATLAATVAVSALAGDARGSGSSAEQAGGAPAEPDVIVIRPGDTLWSIAEALDPEGDPRPLVAELAERAGGPELRPGQRLRVDGLR